MSQQPNTAIAVVGVDIGKNSFHVAGVYTENLNPDVVVMKPAKDRA